MESTDVTGQAKVQAIEEAALEVRPEVKAEAQDPRLAQIIKREKLLRQQTVEAQRKFEVEREQIRSQAREEARAEYQKQIKEQLVKDPILHLTDAGLTQEQAYQYLQNYQPADQHVMRLSQKIQELEAKLGKSTEDVSSQQQQAYESAKGQIRQEVTRLVKITPDKYENLREDNAYEAVVELIDKTLEEDGYMMSIDDAAEEVENYLADQYAKRAQRKTIQDRLKPKEEVKDAKTPSTASSLSHTGASTQKKLTDKERRARAIAVAQGINPDA